MSRTLFLLLPALVLQAQNPAVPGATEVRPGVFVLRGVPNDATYFAIKVQRITHVVDLRRDGEPNLNCEAESMRMQELGAQYMRYAVGKVPPAADLDFLRAFIKDLPKGSKVLVHCGDGNRAAAVVCPWLVLDKGMHLEEALRVSREAGLQLPETEEAVRRYLSSKGRA
jgi:protein tyrosine phosphatase (PTP) superfamily phosphohydrolase (DUF442 family)